MPETVTTVLWNDRHCDPSVFVFSDHDTAFAWAEAKARECDRHGEFAQSEYLNPPTILFTYSCEGDGLVVADVVIDKEVADA